MDVSSLCLFLLLNSLDSGSARVSVVVSPERSQFFRYESFSVSCEDKNDENMTEWTVMKRMGDREVHPCSPCSVSAAFPFTDSGEYWCQSEQGATSNSVNITITAGLVILDSPIHPVMEGDDVPLSCRSILSQTSTSAFQTEFFKDGVFVGDSNTGNMTLYRVSKSDEGLYKCRIFGSKNESQESWLTVRALNRPTNLPSDSPSWLVTLVRHLVVVCPYLVSTILLGLVYKDRRGRNCFLKAQHPRRRRQNLDDVVMETAHYSVCLHT